MASAASSSSSATTSAPVANSNAPQDLTLAAPVSSTASTSQQPASTLDPSRVRHLRACDRCRRRKVRRKNEAPPVTSEEASATVSPTEPPILLNPESTSSYFTTADGLARFCGSTSGLPLLESTRRLSRVPQAGGSSSTAEPDWSWLQELLDGGTAATGASPTAQSASSAPEDQLFFPGRDVIPRSSHEAHNLVVEVIPPDLLGVLLQIFIERIHPSWPILHLPSLLRDTHKWREPAFAALIVSMCMLASRFCNDPRVLAEPNNPVSAGYHYFALFQKLRNMASLASDHLVEACQSLLFAAQYHCVDTLPHPIAQELLANAIARVYDGGLHRSAPTAFGNAVEQEVRKRTAWAIYCCDMQMAALAGRPPLMRLIYFDVDSPRPFPPSQDTPAPINDSFVCEVFSQLVSVCAVMEKTIAATMQPPVFNNNAFLDSLGGRPSYEEKQDFTKLIEVEEMLERWNKQLPASFLGDADTRSRSSYFSASTESVLAVAACCRITLAARRLQLTTATITGERSGAGLSEVEGRGAELKKHALELVRAVKVLVSSGVKMGASGLLWTADIFFAYRLLMAGRLTLAAVIAAQSAGDTTREIESMHTLEACLLLLIHFAKAVPISLGAAETLKETSRVCNVHFTKASLTTSAQGRYAWHRPLPSGAAKPAAPAPVPISHSLSLASLSEAPQWPSTTTPSFPFAPTPLASSPPLQLASTSLDSLTSLSQAPQEDVDAWIRMLDPTAVPGGTPSTSGSGGAGGFTPGQSGWSGEGFTDLAWLYPGGSMLGQ